MTSSTDPRNKTTTYTYDADGNELTVTDPDSNETKDTYDADNELLSTTQGYGTGSAETETYTYDVFGDETSFTDGGSDTTTYGYNELGELTSTTDALGETTSFTYDANGNKLTETDPDGDVATYTYNGQNQVTEISYSDDSTPTVQYQYNADGKLDQMTDGSDFTEPNSTWTYGHGDVLSTYTNGAGAELEYSFDAAGNLLTLEGLSHTITYTYNPMNEIATVEDWNDHTTSFGYNGDGSLTSVDYEQPDINEALTYNAANELTEIDDTNSSDATVEEFQYSPDDAGIDNSETDTGTPDAGTIDYTYNPLDELTGSGASSYSYNGSNDLTTAPNGDAQSYNADDEVTQQGSGSSSSCSSPASGVTTYCYDNEGDRTNAYTTSTETDYYWTESHQLYNVYDDATGTDESYDYDGEGLLQGEAGSSINTAYTWNEDGAQVPEMFSDGTWIYVYGPGDTPIEQVLDSNGTTTYYLLSDHLGSVRGIVNSSGSLVGATTYDAWGNTEGTSGSVTSPFGFAGGYLDSFSELYYFRARWYDPSTGQWMSLDPDVMDTQSPFAYVNNDPVNGVDPGGKQPAGPDGPIANRAQTILANGISYLTWANVGGGVTILGGFEDLTFPADFVEASVLIENLSDPLDPENLVPHIITDPFLLGARNWTFRPIEAPNTMAGDKLLVTANFTAIGLGLATGEVIARITVE